MQDVFVIIGYEGRWFDYHEWTVRAVRSEERAMEVAAELNAKAKDGYGISEGDEDAIFDYPSFTYRKVPMEDA